MGAVMGWDQDEDGPVNQTSEQIRRAWLDGEIGQWFEDSDPKHGRGIVTPLRACGPAGGSVAKGMKKISYRGYRLPPEIIQQAIWLYLRFTLSLRDVEDLLAEQGIMVSYETVRRWVNHFWPMIAANLRKRRPKPHTTWHLDEVYLKIAGRMVYRWRAVDAEGEVLDVLVQRTNICDFFPLL
jgi:hypothetical protein